MKQKYLSICILVLNISLFKYFKYSIKIYVNFKNSQDIVIFYDKIINLIRFVQTTYGQVNSI